MIKNKSMALQYFYIWCQIENEMSLPLKAPITTEAEDKFCDIFPNFRKK